METALVASGNTTPAALLEMAVNKDADIDKLEKLMNMKLKWEENEARKDYHNAMAMFKAESIIVPKDQHVKYGNTKYDHASLFGLVSAVTPKLSEYGLSMSWDVSQDGGKIRVTCVVTHKNGHSERVPMESAADTSGGKNAIQAIGSAAEYLRRYTALAILGIAAGGMDDDGRGSGPNAGNGGGQNHRGQGSNDSPKEKPPLLQKNAKEWINAINAVHGGRIEAVKQHRNISPEVEKDLINDAALMESGLSCPSSDEMVLVSDCSECKNNLGCPSWAQ